MADVCLHAPDNYYETAEDARSVFCHLLVSCVKEKLAQ